MRNYYEALGVAAGADAEDIQGAFHSLAKTFHPDVNTGDALAARRCEDVMRPQNIMSALREICPSRQIDELVRPLATGDLP